MEKQLNVNITKDDMLICSCGSDLFIQVVNVAKIKPFVIDARTHVIPKPVKFVCLDCKLPLTPELKTHGDLKVKE
jgi:hypothetical protein